MSESEQAEPRGINGPLEIGTPLTHDQFGDVLYWRYAPELGPNYHVIEKGDGDLAYVSGTRLTY